MDIDALRTSIAALELRKEELQKETDRVNLELAIQNARYALLLNDGALVYRLPNEILTAIFLMCHHDVRISKKATSTVPFQVTVSHVSHLWRTVVLSTPLLWNTIDFRIERMNHVQGRVLSQVDAHLIHSGTCFLDITLDFHIESELSVYLDRLAKHASRWRRLSIATRYESVDDVHSLLQEAHTPILEHLSLSLGRPQEGFGALSPRKPYVNVSPSVLTSGPRALSFVRLAGLALGQLHPPLLTITTLHLDGWTRHYMRHDQLKDILDDTPLLVNLSLNQLVIHHPRDPLEVVQIVKLPHLRCLRIRGPCSPVSVFLSLMETPQLHLLSLHNIETFNSEALSSVKSLTMDGCSMDELEVRNLFRALPSISSLSVDEGVPDIFSMLRPDNGVSKPWPRLQVISLRNLQPVDVAHFCIMVFSLQDSSNALTKLYLDRRSRTTLRAKHRLDWLHDRVEVERCDTPDLWPIGLGYNDTHDLLE